MLKKIALILIGGLLLFSCKMIQVKDQDTLSKIIFKNLMKSADSVNDIAIKGLFKVVGVKEVPPGYIAFESKAKLKEHKGDFLLSFLKKPILEVVMDNSDIYFVNHTGKQYIKFNFEQVDLSRVLGVNFNPLEIYYFLLGRIPYDENMQLMDFKYNKKEYIMEITNQNSKYTLFLNSNKEITKAIIADQFFGTLLLDSVIYTKNDDNRNTPKNLVFSNEEKNIKLSFKISRMSFKPIEGKLFDDSFLKDYKQETSMESIKVKLR